MTDDAAAVTQPAGADQASPGGRSPSTSAERMRRKRERDRLAAETTRRFLASDAQRAAEARQVGLPLGPSGAELEPIDGGAGGRPGGSVSRWTEEWRRRMLASYRSPLIVMAEIYSRPVHELARELRCTPLEAMRLQLDAAKDLAPHLHSKMPTSLQLETGNMVPIVIGMTDAAASSIGVSESGAFRIPKTLDHQGVKDGEND